MTSQVRLQVTLEQKSRYAGHNFIKGVIIIGSSKLWILVTRDAYLERAHSDTYKWTQLEDNQVWSRFHTLAQYLQHIGVVNLPGNKHKSVSTVTFPVKPEQYDTQSPRMQLRSKKSERTTRIRPSVLPVVLPCFVFNIVILCLYLMSINILWLLTQIISS